MKKTINTHKKALYVASITATLLAGAYRSQAVTLLAEDFNSGDGGFTVVTPQPYDGPWVYTAASGSWTQAGQHRENQRPNTSKLHSPSVTLPASGPVTLSFTHRYSFELNQMLGLAWDGGQVRISVNGSSYTPVPGGDFLQNGYNGTVPPGSGSELHGQAAFTATSPGFAFLTSLVDLGDFSGGDTLSIEFIAGNDSNTRGPNQPNWEITDFSLTSPNSAVPDATGTIGLLTLGLGSLLATRRLAGRGPK